MFFKSNHIISVGERSSWKLLICYILVISFSCFLSQIISFPLDVGLGWCELEPGSRSGLVRVSFRVSFKRSNICCCLLLLLLSSAACCCCLLLLAAAVFCCLLLQLAACCCLLLLAAVFCCLLLSSAACCCSLLLLLSSAACCCCCLLLLLLLLQSFAAAVFGCCSLVNQWSSDLLASRNLTIWLLGPCCDGVLAISSQANTSDPKKLLWLKLPTVDSSSWFCLRCFFKMFLFSLTKRSFGAYSFLSFLSKS